MLTLAFVKISSSEGWAVPFSHLFNKIYVTGFGPVEETLTRPFRIGSDRAIG